MLSDSPGPAPPHVRLAGAVLLSQSGLTRLVDRLVRAGSVERTRCEEDRRGHYAELTSAGRARFEARPVRAPGGGAGALPRPVDEDDLQALAAFWERVLPGATAE